jgi:HEAT repeat protein
LNEAMLALPQKSWAGPLKAALEPAIVPPTGKDDVADKMNDYRDQLFWQTTAAEVLGVLQDESAVEPLLRVMLDPTKADVQPTALLALVKIGKPAADRTIKVLSGADEKLVNFATRRVQEVTKAKEPPKDRPYVPTAALILGTIGRADTIGAMVEALKKEDKDVNKAILARELAKIPATPQSKDAFKSAFESISLETNVPPGDNALQMLAESAGMFYDPGMIEWLLGRAEATKGAGDDKKALQTAITVTVLKLAKPEQLPLAKRAVTSYGTQLEKDLYATSEKLLKACGDRASCYLAEIEKGENQDQKNQFAAIKAGYMIAMLGNEQSRDELIARLESIENPAVRFTAASAIDYLSPKGSKDAASKLRAIITKNKQSADSNKVQGDAPLKLVMYRVESRAS